ncbi:MAG: HDOD domain-containing protein [Betaproteobacteria bacterium]|nr:HDOD domain-containing protein [Betaproteobacteria bacterium]
MNHPHSLPVDAAPALGPSGLFTNEDEDALCSVFESWPRLAESEHSMPPVSPLIFRLLQVDRDAPLAVAEVAEIVESDPILTARLLGLANSAAFVRAGRPINDVRSAVLRLGLYNAFESTFTQLFGMWVRHASRMPDDGLLDVLWLEYLLTAFSAREIARTLGDRVVDPGTSYTSALLHDVGTLALCWAEPWAMQRFVAQGYARGTGLHEQFVEAHTRLGASLLESWNAPAELARVAGEHHRGLRDSVSPVASIVYIADHLHDAVLANEHAEFRVPEGYRPGCFGPVSEEVTAALCALGLENRIEEIIERVAKQSGRIDALAGASR